MKWRSHNRCHHVLKTFWDWLARQLPDGTGIWTSPSGQTYTTHPGCRLLFPTLCKRTVPVSVPSGLSVEPSRGLMMPRRKTTRAQDRAKRIEAERARTQVIRENPENNWDDACFPSRPPPVGESDDPPPF